MIKNLILNFSIIFNMLILSNADLRMASTPKNDFKIQNAKNAIPYTDISISAVYMEPSDFDYQGLKNQRKNNYDNFLRSNIDNEQDNRDFYNEVGRDMLPFRTYEGLSINNNLINISVGEEMLIPIRWNNPHASECEINIWTKSNLNDNIVIPIKKPSCCGEGYQDNIISLKIPSDFDQLVKKIPGFAGCNNVGDCTMQIYAHSVEPRTYAIGTPIIINGSSLIVGTYEPAINNNLIQPATFDPQYNLDYLTHQTCLSTLTTNILSAVPRFARLVSDQFNHAYQNSNFSAYSGQQHECISRNLQSSIILRMTAANGGELGRSIINKEATEFINNLINNVNNVVEKYEKTANDIFNSIKNENKFKTNIMSQELADCFRCAETGSVNTNRIEQKTYIPSFEIKDINQQNNVRNMLDDDVKNLLPANSNIVQIYEASLKDLLYDFKIAKQRGFEYQPAMIKNTMTTMKDLTNFTKVDFNGNKDGGVYAANLSLKTKKENIDYISKLISSPQTSSPPTNSPSKSTSSLRNTLPPNPDDFYNSNFCGKTYETVECNRHCPSGLDVDCGVDKCFLVSNMCN